jgi:hypothetical protein
MGSFLPRRATIPAVTRSNAKQVTASDPGEIAQVAYELYVQRGRVHGHDLEDWLRAEQIVWARAKR